MSAGAALNLATLTEDDRAEMRAMQAEERLIDFIRLMWPSVEPQTEYLHGWPLEALCEHLEAVAAGEITRLIINVPPGFMKSLATCVFLPAWIWGPRGQPHHRFLCASYTSSLTERDNLRTLQVVKSELYQRHWGRVYRMENEGVGKLLNNKTGWKLATSVGGVGTGERGSILLIDDPNSVKQAESQTVRDSTNQWLMEVLPTRLSDPRRSAIVVIQQRTHEEDATGTLLKAELGYEHLMIPMEWDGRRYHTVIGWTDPRTVEDIEPGRNDRAWWAVRGELAFADRFPAWVVERDKKTLGTYACNPGEAPVLMSDLSLKRIEDVRLGDEVVGFDLKERTDDKIGRRKLTRARVLNVFSSVKQVVKITLDSGQTIRCTPDHKWYTGRFPEKKHMRQVYAAAKVGSEVARICPADLPRLSAEDERLAGWLSGFFDGEGTVSNCAKSEQYRASAQIHFYQGSGRNLPLCEKLEAALSRFGFEFAYEEDERKPNKDAPCYGYRNYRLLSHGLPMYQRFLHIVQPTKWRGRIIDGAYGAKFVKGWERVVSIEPDGEEMTYALETTAGNYVVWGLASSNSAGQFQQAPEPRGGGIIKREWWQRWEPTDVRKPKFPPFDVVVGFYDGAHTEKTQNDPGAMSVMGTFTDPMTGMPKVMLVKCWAERLALNDAVKRINETCLRCGVSILLVENKATGYSVVQELQRLFIGKPYSITLTDPRGSVMGRGGYDKVARAMSVVPIFEDEIVYAPCVMRLGDDGRSTGESGWTDWAEAAIDECAVFPRGSHDDRVDTIVGALRWMRDAGMLMREVEAVEAEREAVAGFDEAGRQQPLYRT